MLECGNPASISPGVPGHKMKQDPSHSFRTSFRFRLPIFDWGEKQMHERIWMLSSSSRSDNRKSKIENRKWAGLFAIVVALTVCGARAEAQQPTKVHRIGYLSPVDAATDSPRAEGIRLALRELGYIEGQNIAIEYRYAEGKVDRAPELAAELVRLKVDIIVVASGDQWIRAAKNATKTIPIVMTGQGSDPVRGRPCSKPCPSRRQRHRPYNPWQGTRREAAGAAQRSGTQTFPCRGSLRSGQSAKFTRGKRASPSRRACAKVDYSTLGNTSGGRLREGLCCAKQAAPGWTLRDHRGRGNAS